MDRQTVESKAALDGYLVASAKTGNRNDLGLLFRRWNGRLLAHAWRLLGDREAARDAVQETWAEIVRGLDRLVEPDAFPIWAYRIVSRRCARHIRAKQKDRRLIATVAAEACPVAVQPNDEAPDLVRIHAALSRLPPDQRAALALFYLEEMSVAEVAVALDVPAGTVKTRLMHARRKLRAALEGEE